MSTNLLYIRLLKEQGFHYGVPNNITSEYDKTFDLDNFSSQEVMSMAIQFLEQKDVQVIIESEPLAQVNKLMHVFNAIRKIKDLNVEFIGDHPMKNYLNSF